MSRTRGRHRRLHRSHSTAEEKIVTKLRVHNLSVSLDGYAAGPDQDRENPLGVGGERLHERVFTTAPAGG